MNEPDPSGVDPSRADDIDLSGVDPRRWPEIRRRVAILRGYVAVDEPTGDTTKIFAARMGVGLSTFYALAKIWRTTRDPSKLHGARRTYHDGRAFNETRNVPQEALAIVAGTIEDLGLWSRDAAIHGEVGRRIAHAGLAPTSRATTRMMILKARSSSSAPSDMRPSVLLERCVLKLPLADGAVPVHPQAMLAVAIPENRVLAWRVGVDGDPPSVREVLDDVLAHTTPGALIRPLSGPRLRPDDLARIDLPVDRTSRRTRLRMALGADLGGIGFVTQAARTVSADALIYGKLDRLMTRRDVDDALAAAVARHNAGKTKMPAFAIATDFSSED